MRPRPFQGSPGNCSVFCRLSQLPTELRIVWKDVPTYPEVSCTVSRSYVGGPMPIESPSLLSNESGGVRSGDTMKAVLGRVQRSVGDVSQNYGLRVPLADEASASEWALLTGPTARQPDNPAARQPNRGPFLAEPAAQGRQARRGTTVSDWADFTSRTNISALTTAPDLISSIPRGLSCEL